MNRLIIRHALSEANNRGSFGSPAFASGEAPLMAEGWDMARRLSPVLPSEYGVVLATAEAATSEMLRTHQTAIGAGFDAQNLTAYNVLNEVSRV